ncbi:hypothetical protein HWV07_03760 [Natronomonas salina]|uniref:hypothetical protein n=1 Tax=Natronomonas salina TaxID=1710540 RepID=UPI0015B42CCA|nr:hypothetical protein [Natronomonas salina]QLD88195.1 hypothetical protein HWV07_03760 [Natronomonas salina]
MRETSATRRGVLAAAGGALLAGCSGLDEFGESSDEEIRSSRLPDLTDDGESQPVVVETMPIEIERTVLAERVQRTTDLLATLPMSFGADDVPNGYVRKQLIEAAEDASEYIQDARTAQSRLTAMRSLQRARSEARFAAAGWGFVEDGTTETARQSEHEAVIEDANALRSDHAYLGEDPVEAVLFHAEVEQHLAFVAENRYPSGSVNTDELLTVAEWGEHTEYARARVDDGRYLYDRFRESLPADAGSIEETLTTAGESLVDELQRRRSDLPAEPTEGDHELVWRLRYRVRDAAESSARYAGDEPGAASTVLRGAEGLADFLAYERIRDRIDDGEQFGVEEAADVHDARDQAVESVRTALDESPRAGLARPVLADAAQQIVAADEELARLRGTVRPARLDDPIRRYVTATARARSVPAACQEVLDTLTQ